MPPRKKPPATPEEKREAERLAQQARDEIEREFAGDSTIAVPTTEGIPPVPRTAPDPLDELAPARTFGTQKRQLALNPYEDQSGFTDDYVMQPGDTMSRPLTEADKQLIMAGKTLPRPRQAPPAPVEPVNTMSTKPRAPVIDIVGPERHESTPPTANLVQKTPESRANPPRDYTGESRRFVNDSGELYGYHNPEPDQGTHWEDEYLANTRQPGKDNSGVLTFLYGPKMGMQKRQQIAQEQAIYQSGLNQARQADLERRQLRQNRSQFVENEIGQGLQREDSNERAKEYAAIQRAYTEGKRTRSTESLTEQDWSFGSVHMADEIIKRTGRNVHPQDTTAYLQTGDRSTLPPSLMDVPDDVLYRARAEAMNGMTGTATNRAQLTPGLAANAGAIKERRALPYQESSIKAMSEIEGHMKHLASINEQWRQLSPKAKKAIVQAGQGPITSAIVDALVLTPDEQVVASQVQGEINQYIHDMAGVAQTPGEIGRAMRATGLTAQGYNPFQSPKVLEHYFDTTYTILGSKRQYRKRIQSDQGQGM